MKTIGQTNEGGFLVVLTPDEHSALGALIDALEGGYGHYDIIGRRWDSADLSNALATIHTYARHLGMINALKELTVSLEKVIKSKSGPPEPK